MTQIEMADVEQIIILTFGTTICIIRFILGVEKLREFM